MTVMYSAFSYCKFPVNLSVNPERSYFELVQRGRNFYWGLKRLMLFEFNKRAFN